MKKKSLALITIAISLTGCGSYDIFQCEEAIRITDCKIEDNSTPVCTFENVTQGVIKGRFKTWSYNSDEILIHESVSIQIHPLNPGQKKRAWIGSTEKRASKFIICSVDPSSALVKDKIRKIDG